MGYRDIPGLADGHVVGKGWTTFYNRERGWKNSGLWDRIIEAVESAAGSTVSSPTAPADFHCRDGPSVRPAEIYRRRADANSKLSRADINAAELPAMVMGRRLRPNSEKAEIIRGIIAVLRKQGWAPKWEIERVLREVGIVSLSNSSSNRLSVILSECKDLFANCRLEGVGERGWYLRETEKEGSNPETASP